MYQCCTQDETSRHLSAPVGKPHGTSAASGEFRRARGRGIEGRAPLLCSWPC